MIIFLLSKKQTQQKKTHTHTHTTKSRGLIFDKIIKAFDFDVIF